MARELYEAASSSEENVENATVKRLLLKRHRRPMEKEKGVCFAWEITWALLGPGNELW